MCHKVFNEENRNARNWSNLSLLPVNYAIKNKPRGSGTCRNQRHLNKYFKNWNHFNWFVKNWNHFNWFDRNQEWHVSKSRPLQHQIPKPEHHGFRLIFHINRLLPLQTQPTSFRSSGRFALYRSAAEYSARIWRAKLDRSEDFERGVFIRRQRHQYPTTFTIFELHWRNLTTTTGSHHLILWQAACVERVNILIPIQTSPRAL